MKKNLLFALMATPLFSIAQLNITQVGYVDFQALHGTGTSNLWGYEDELGNEYAIVGANNGVSIIDVTNPSSPNEVFFEPGSNSIWREVKTYNNFAYITTEAEDGMMIIDLNPLPGSTTLPVTYFFGPAGNEWLTAHSLFIDENGILYLHGTNRGNGGVILYDLNTSPTNPTEVGEFDNWYVHDSYARGDTLYSAHINDGYFSITDVSNPSSITLMAGLVNTPMNFTHNCWLSANGKYLFTTDEKSGAWIGAYDISDFSNIQEVDRIRRDETSGVIPHNTYWLNNYLVTSYYRDGITIHDVTDPSNMIEVGNFDTSPSLSGDGFNGAWGVYPFFSSGKLIVSDIELGLYILEPTYVRACYLQGNVTDASTLANLNSAHVEILSTPNFDDSDLNGFYSSGVSTPGTYQVVYSKPGYISDTVTVSLTAGNIDTVNVALVPLPVVTITGQVADVATSTGLNAATVSLTNSLYTYTATTDATGNFSISGFVLDPAANTFDITVGLWGYQTYCATGVLVTDVTGPLNFDLAKGFYDDFSLDFGWTASATSPAGHWVREEPYGTMLGSGNANPETDVMGDCFDKAYVTGNTNSASVGADDIDNGNAELTSPAFNTTGLTDAYLTYFLWFANGGGAGAPNDTVHVFINDGTNHLVEKCHISNFTLSSWIPRAYKISDYTSATTNLKLVVRAQDYNPGHVVECAVDLFKITEGNPFLGIAESKLIDNGIQVYPNPAHTSINVLSENNITEMIVFDVTGKQVLNLAVNSKNVLVNIDQLENGIYLIKTVDSARQSKITRFIKE